MSVLFNLIGGIKGIIVIALILAAGLWIYTKQRDLDRATKAVEAAEVARDQAIVQRNQAGVERDKAIAAAQTNSDTISRLEQERDLANRSLNSLAKAKAANNSNAAARDAIIEREASVPANAAVAAPVLGTLISEIQADRLRRRGKEI